MPTYRVIKYFMNRYINIRASTELLNNVSGFLAMENKTQF